MCVSLSPSVPLPLFLRAALSLLCTELFPMEASGRGHAVSGCVSVRRSNSTPPRRRPRGEGASYGAVRCGAEAEAGPPSLSLPVCHGAPRPLAATDVELGLHSPRVAWRGMAARRRINPPLTSATAGPASQPAPSTHPSVSWLCLCAASSSCRGSPRLTFALPRPRPLPLRVARLTAQGRQSVVWPIAHGSVQTERYVDAYRESIGAPSGARSNVLPCPPGILALPLPIFPTRSKADDGPATERNPSLRLYFDCDSTRLQLDSTGLCDFAVSERPVLG